MSGALDHVADLVRGVIIAELALATDVLHDGLALAALDADPDALDWINIICELEAEFGIAITDEDLADAATVGDLIAFVQGRLGEPVAS